jgi:hypothetical protein
METTMAEQEEKELRTRIREGMPVLAMDGDVLGHVYEVGDHALAVERGAFVAREWRCSFSEVHRVDDGGVWLRNGRGSLERISDNFCGPTDAYRPAVEASPIYHQTLFRSPAVAHGEHEHPDELPGDKPPPDR